jgi:hypothetical protein
VSTAFPAVAWYTLVAFAMRVATVALCGSLQAVQAS